MRSDTNNVAVGTLRFSSTMTFLCGKKRGGGRPPQNVTGPTDTHLFKKRKIRTVNELSPFGFECT